MSRRQKTEPTPLWKQRFESSTQRTHSRRPGSAAQSLLSGSGDHHSALRPVPGPPRPRSPRQALQRTCTSTPSKAFFLYRSYQ
ncbi:hypothetical protein SLA2020_273890 [Shorea laevis]